MSLSLIKELWLKIKNSPSVTIPLDEEQEKNNTISIEKENLNRENKILPSKDYKFISDFFSQKFPEVREIFSKFNGEDYFTFIENSDFKEFAINETIYEKNTMCDCYLFILYGDIDFFDIKEGDNKDKILIKTISAGKVYGHMVKEKYKYNLIARTNISLISINKKFFDSENTNSFIERQKKFIEDKKQKEEKFKENLIKKKQEEIDKSNILVKHSFNKKDIIRGINDLTEWENNRKRKLEERQKQIEEEKINKYKYRPKIDKNSILLASKNIQRQKESNVFMRLAQDDKVLKEKKKILIQLNTPSFRPELYKTKRKKFIMNSNKVKEFDTVSKRYKSEVNMDNSDLDIEDEKYDESYDSNGNGEKDDYIDSNIFTEENIQNAYRKAIFHKRKK